MTTASLATAEPGVAQIADALSAELATALQIAAAGLAEPAAESFQQRGLRSLGALRIQYRLHERLGVLVPLGDLLGACDVQALARRVHAQAQLDVQEA